MSRWGNEAWRQLKDPRRSNKYGAVKVELDGYQFDSKKEAWRYNELKLMQNAGTIGPITVHPKYPIYIKDFHVCDVELDFAYNRHDDFNTIHEDVKSAGTDTALSKLKRKLVEAFYGFKVVIIE